MSRGKAEAALVWNTLVWGTTFVLVKAALRDVTPILFLAIRFSLAAVALLAIFHKALWRKPQVWKGLGAGALTGVFLFSGYLLQTLGLRGTSAAKSAFITGLCSVMVPLLAALVYRNRPRIFEVAGVLVATAGMSLMTLEGVTAPISRGDLLTFFCAIAFAMHIVVLGHYSEEVSFELLSVAQIGTCAVLALGLFAWAEKPAIHWRPAVVSAILITGLLATALAFTIQSWAQRYTTSTRAALIFTLEPVFAWITSYCILGEGLSGRAAAGAGLILGGVLLVEMKPWNPRGHPSS